MYRQVRGQSLVPFHRLPDGLPPQVPGGLRRFIAHMITDLDELVKSAVSEVFQTMLHTHVEDLRDEGALRHGESHVAGAVGFIGEISGVVYIYCPAGFAQAVTARLLGLEAREIEGEEMVNDAIGELANMVVGQLKSRLCERGLNCVLTIPSIVRGSQFSVEAISNIERRVRHFRCDGQPFAIETLIKSENARN